MVTGRLLISKIISNVPADSLVRTERPPNKEILRYFIRHNALRAGIGENAPWVVEDELVKKYSLPSKFSDFLLDPHKVRVPKRISFGKWGMGNQSSACQFGSGTLELKFKRHAEQEALLFSSVTSVWSDTLEMSEAVVHIKNSSCSVL